MATLAPDIRMKNRAGLIGTQPTSAPSLPPAAPAVTMATAIPLEVAYERYRIGKGFGRSDLFRVIIDEIQELKRRIGGVDEAAVQAIGDRVTAMERVIGNAMSAHIAPEPAPRRGRPPKAAEPANE